MEPPRRKKPRLSKSEAEALTGIVGMIVGNNIFVEMKDQWSTVSHVEIGGVKHKYAVVGMQISCDISLYPRRTSNLPISSLPPVIEYTLTENWAAKIRCDCVRNVIGEEYREVVPYTRTVNPSPDPDSDDEGPLDEVFPTLDQKEVCIIQENYKTFYAAYKQAVSEDFQNAYGKLFLMALGSLLLPNHTSLISTNPKGNFQPGALNVTWVVPGKETRSTGTGLCEHKQDRIA